MGPGAAPSPEATYRGCWPRRVRGCPLYPGSPPRTPFPRTPWTSASGSNCKRVWLKRTPQGCPCWAARMCSCWGSIRLEGAWGWGDTPTPARCLSTPVPFSQHQRLLPLDAVALLSLQQSLLPLDATALLSAPKPAAFRRRRPWLEHQRLLPLGAASIYQNHDLLPLDRHPSLSTKACCLSTPLPFSRHPCQNKYV